jgi:hypothetical protein
MPSMHCLEEWAVKDAPDAIKSAKAHELICSSNPLTAKLKDLERQIANRK